MEQLLNIPTPIIVWGSFFIAGLITYLNLILHYKLDIKSRNFLVIFISKDWSHNSVLVDIFLYLFGKITGPFNKLATPIITLIFSHFLASQILLHFPDVGHHHLGIIGYAICGFLLLLVNDFSGYAAHVALHYVPVLWELHKVHHSAEFLNPLTAKRGHPLDGLFADFLNALLMGVPTGFLIAIFDLDITKAALLVAFSNKIFFTLSLETLQHSHFPINFGLIDRVIVSPHMHQIHHSSRREHWDKNFGYIFSIWDWVFGTAYEPTKGEEIVYGIGETETLEYQTISGTLITPLVKIHKIIKMASAKKTLEGVLWRPPSSLEYVMSASLGSERKINK